MFDPTRMVLVLGHNGMLGSCVATYLQAANFNVLTIDSRWDSPGFQKELLSFRGDYIVNCIGSFPNKNSSDQEIVSNNYELPIWIMRNSSSKQIIAGSDAEFSGEKELGTYYDVDSPSDATDTYGIYKAKLSQDASSSTKTRVIRTSIIGIETKTSRSLLSWILSRKDGEIINGYVNVHWNGVTTLEWAKTCSRLMSDWDGTRNGALRIHRNIVQVGTQPVSKFELIEHVATVFEKRLRIQPVQTEKSSNRCLFPSNQASDIQNQLVELKEYYGL